MVQGGNVNHAGTSKVSCFAPHTYGFGLHYSGYVFLALAAQAAGRWKK